jgi:hypothetical protein
MRVLMAGCVGLAVALAMGAPAMAQRGYDPAARIAAQKEAMAKLAAVSGEWRGPAKTMLDDGTWHEITQTERMGPMLDGTLRVIEGRGYEADGKLSFNAFGVISWDPDAKAYAFHSYAQGREGSFPWMVTPTGFAWETPAGPQMTIHYEITLKDGTWHEVGTRVMKSGGEPVKFFEMTLKRIGDTTWPAAGVVPPR